VRYSLSKLERNFGGTASSAALAAAAFCLFAGSAVVFLLFLHKSIGNPGLWRPDRWLLAALILLSAAITLTGVAFRRSAGDRTSLFWAPLGVSLSSALVSYVVAESAVRLGAKPDPFGLRFHRTILIPYSWDSLAEANRTYLRQSRSTESYFVEDPQLGWSVGSNRISADGMYRSSREGLRSEEAGVSLRTRPAKSRIGLFGDSFTFSLEVPFEQSWGDHLRRILPSGTQVLNFGVDGFGLDQAYLRFMNEAPRWKLNVAILSFIHDDLYRMVGVYPFLRGWQYPFSKPRFVLQDGELKLVNVPNQPPDAIFAVGSIWNLPLLDYDIQFIPDAWNDSRLYISYLARFLATVFPRRSDRGVHNSDEAIVNLGARLIEEFVASARPRNIEPLIVYLPAHSEFSSYTPVLKDRVSHSVAEKGIAIHDLTACLIGHVAPAQLFVSSGIHYSEAGNVALAKCVEPLVSSSLN
jgi:hypothetical protein